MERLYKATDENATCRDYQYTVGKLHVHEGPVAICHSGFHACRNLEDVFGYYTRPAEIYVCEGNVVDKEETKVVCDKIRLIRQVTVQELWKQRKKHWRIRRSIVAHPEVTIEMLKKLTDDIDVDIRKEVAKHPKITIKMLKKLAKDWDREVRVATIDNPRITIDILNMLSKSKGREVRVAVVRHPKTTRKTLKSLVDDESRTISRIAKERLNK